MRARLILTLTALSATAIAQPPPGPRPPRPATIQVTGQAQVSKTPDRVYIDPGAEVGGSRLGECGAPLFGPRGGKNGRWPQCAADHGTILHQSQLQLSALRRLPHSRGVHRNQCGPGQTG